MDEMVRPDPRDAVLQLVTAPRGERTHTGPQRGPFGRAGRAAYTQSGPGFGAVPSTVRFLKTRDLGDVRLFVVDFTCSDGGTFEWAVIAEREDDGWHASGICGQGTGQGFRGTGRHRTEPWANLGGQWGVKRSVISGLIEGPSPLLIDRVRLRAGDDILDEDLVEDQRVLLFTTEHADGPLSVDMVDGSGTVVRTQTWPESTLDTVGHRAEP